MMWNFYSHTSLYENVYSISNYQKLKKKKTNLPQLGNDKRSAVYPYNGILPRNKKEWTMDTGNIYESQKHCVK